jgi:hypothetical protein
MKKIFKTLINKSVVFAIALTFSSNLFAQTITPASASVYKGQTITLIGSPTPAAVSPWVSSSTLIATVTSGGVVTGVNPGQATITYKNSNNALATAIVTILPLSNPARAFTCNNSVSCNLISNPGFEDGILPIFFAGVSNNYADCWNSFQGVSGSVGGNNTVDLMDSRVSCGTCGTDCWEANPNIAGLPGACVGIPWNYQSHGIVNHHTPTITTTSFRYACMFTGEYMNNHLNQPLLSKKYSLEFWTAFGSCVTQNPLITISLLDQNYNSIGANQVMPINYSLPAAASGQWKRQSF